jgi:hypothetical protein
VKKPFKKHIMFVLDLLVPKESSQSSFGLKENHHRRALSSIKKISIMRFQEAQEVFSFPYIILDSIADFEMFMFR